MPHFQDSSDPTGVLAVGEVGKEVERARDRKANAALQLHIGKDGQGGEDWDTIAEVLGYPSARHARIATERALEKELHDHPATVSRMRLLANKRLEQMLRAVWAKATDPGCDEQLTAITRAREIIADHRRLYGLDEATKVEVSSPTDHELQVWVAGVIKNTVPQLEEADIFGDILDAEIVTSSDA